MPSLRTSLIGDNVNEDTSQRAREVFAGDNEDNPTIRVPSYFIKIINPLGQTYANLATNLKSELALPPSSLFSFSDTSENIRDILTGTTSSETEFSHLDVQVKVNRRRWKRSPETTVKIFNPRKEKVEIIKRGSLIKIYNGWEGKTKYLTFYGTINKVSQEWEDSGDFFIKIHCTQYEEAVMNHATFWQPGQTTAVHVDVDPSNDGYYTTLENLVNDHLSPIANTIFGIPLKLDGVSTFGDNTRLKNIIKLRDVPNTVTNLKFTIKPKRTQTLADILDDFFKQAAPNTTGGSVVDWWVDKEGIIRFPFNENTGNYNGSKAIIGDNTFKISIVSDSPDILEFTGQNLTEPTDTKQDVSLIVHMVGRAKTVLGEIFKVDEAYSEGVINTIDQQGRNFGIQSIRNEKWIVDQIIHKLDSESSYTTQLVLVMPGESSDTTETTGRSTRNRDRLNTLAALKADMRREFDEKLDALKREMGNFAIFGTNDGRSELPASVVPPTNNDPTSINETGAEDTDISPEDSPQSEITGTITGDPSIVDPPVPTDQPADNYIVANRMTYSSPYAIEFKDFINGNYYGGGMWMPVSRQPYANMRRRAVLQTIGGQDIVGLSHWAQGKAPIGLNTDYLLRLPSRGIDLIPSEPLDSPSTVLTGPIKENDDSTRTQIMKQHLMESNPLTDGRVRGVISRPNIKDILDNSGTTGTKDDDVVLMVSNKNRTVNSKVIIRHGDQDTTAVDDVKPEIHIILDDSRPDTERQEIIMKNIDGVTPTVDIISGKVSATLEGKIGSEKISLLLDKATPTANAITLTDGQATVLATTVRMEADNLDVTGVITGGAT